MKHTIKSIILLAAILIGGAGQAWATVSNDPNLGKIVYTESANDHGSLAFYKEEACTNHINKTSDGFVYSFGLTSVKDGSDETIGYKVYIKAIPAFGYTLEAGDETTGKVSFIKAEVTVAGTDVAGARSRGAAVTVNVGDFIDVTATDTRGIYCITMPADKNLNLHITATFKEKSKNTAALRYIDANGETQTKNAGEVYILDGTEISLGKTGETTWYVVNEDINYATYSSANYYLQLNGEVHLILADGKKMTVGKSDNPGRKVGIDGSSYSLTIYGQGGDAEGSLEVYTAKTVYSINLDAVTICGGNVITSQGVTVDEFNIYGGSFEDKQVVESPSALPHAIKAKVVNISGGKVKCGAEIYVDASTDESDITINGGEIEAYCLWSITGGVTISGGQVTLTAPGNAIESNTNITLGWTDPTDFIKVADSYYCKSGTLSIADGKRFIAYKPGATESDPMTATAVISGASGTDFELSAIVGKVLKPCDDNFVKLIEGVTASATDGESVTIGTETLYKVASGAEVTLSATDSDNKKLSSVTVTEADLIDNGDNTFTFTMGTSDVTVTAATFLEKVSYFDPTAEGDNKTNTVFATPLTGNETTLAAGWYVVNEDIDYTTVHSGESVPSVLSATGNVNLILDNGKTMNIGSAESPVSAHGIRFSTAATLAIYGQGGTTEGSLNIYTNNGNPINSQSDITIYGGNLTVNHELFTNGTFTIHGGTFNDARTNGSSTAINAAEINICGGTVTSVVSELYSNNGGTGDINISGGVVNVRCLSTTKGSIAISGGQVTLTERDVAISSSNGITLGWTNATDFISVEPNAKYSSTSADGILTISKGKPFLAISGDNPRDYYDSKSTFTRDNYAIFTALTGKTLKPALKITLPEGVTAAGTDVYTSETAGTYAIYGAKVTLSGTATAGYTFSFTVKDASNNDVTVESNGFTMPATDVTVTATQTAIPATAPTISTQPSGLSLFYGYNSDNVLSISASAAEGHTLSYQWYSNNSNSTSGGTAINEATESSYTVPTGMSVGTTYYYCVVTATRSDNSQTATTTTNVATVTVSKVPTEINVSEATIELEANNEISTGATLTPAEAGNLVYTSSNTSVAEVESGKIIALGIGTATITVSFAGDDTYEAAESKTIEVTVNPITLTLNEGTGSGEVIVIPGGGSSMEVSLTYSRTLTAPTESNKDVTIGGQAAKLYTTCLPTAPATGDNVKYYILSGVSGKLLNFSEVTSPVADTPYLMAVTGSSNATESVTDQDVTLQQKVTGANADGFTMMGTQTGLSNTDAISAASSGNVTYILQDQDKWGKVVNGDVYIPPFRAFIVGPDVSTNGARLLYSSFEGDSTGIQNIRTVDADGTEQWYDLNGRRIAKPTTKGVYIHNGKKTTN